MKHTIVWLGICLSTTVFVAGCTSLQRPAISNATANQQDPQELFDIEVANLGNDLQQNSDELGLKSELQEQVNMVAAEDFYYPMSDYQKNTTRKIFGQFIPDDGSDRFTGYHTGDDIEVTDVTLEVPVYALADAKLVHKEYVSGYGGVMILEFQDADEEIYHALYGHIDLASVTHSIGDIVVKGEQLGNLGDDTSTETDGERKHLHFGVYAFNGTELYAGYVQDDVDLAAWINPSEFLRTHYAQEPGPVSETDISDAIGDIITSNE